MKRAIAITLIVFCLTGCGDIKDCLEEKNGRCGSSEPTPDPATPVPANTKKPSKTPEPLPTVETLNPFCSGTQDSRKHLLWKPVGDAHAANAGNAGIVFDGKYKREFLSVKAELKNGQFKSAYWKPLTLWGNPDHDGPRQAWRLGIKCGEFKKKALIVVDDTIQTCTFQLPGDPCKRHE